MFDALGLHYCPTCGPEKAELRLTEANFMDTGVDIANCEKCGRGFAITYRVDKIKRCQSWDTGLIAEQQK